MAEGSFWQVGERVVSRMWSPGEQIGTITKVEVLDKPELAKRGIGTNVRVQEWVTVKFDDGYERECASFDTVKSPTG